MKKIRFASGLMVLVLLVLSMESCMGQGVINIVTVPQASDDNRAGIIRNGQKS